MSSKYLVGLEFGYVLAIISSVPIFRTSGRVHVLEAKD